MNSPFLLQETKIITKKNPNEPISNRQNNSSVRIFLINDAIISFEVVGVIFIAFKDTFVEWATGLWDAISEKFSEFTAGIKQWFQDTIQPILIRHLKRVVKSWLLLTRILTSYPQ